MAGSTELPGLMEVVERLRPDRDRCRKYAHVCVAGTLVVNALHNLAVRNKQILVDKLYEDVISQIRRDYDLLSEDLEGAIAEVLHKTVKYLEMRGNIKNGVATREDMLMMAAHIDTAMIFLDCW
jgi:hypothetical protein